MTKLKNTTYKYYITELALTWVYLSVTVFDVTLLVGLTPPLSRLASTASTDK